MSGSVRSQMPPPLSHSSTIGWRTTTPCIPIPDWAIAHPGSTSFPNPSRVRFDRVNSTRNDVQHQHLLRVEQIGELGLTEWRAGAAIWKCAPLWTWIGDGDGDGARYRRLVKRG